MTGVIKKVGSKSCWICGTTEKLTRAHAIPQMYNPKQNVKMILCVTCHRKVDLRFQVQRQLRDTIHTLRELLKEYEVLRLPVGTERVRKK